MISKLTSEILEKILEEVKKPENITKVHNNVIDPLISYSFNRLYPYIFVAASIFILILVLAITILFLVIRFNVCQRT
jgi:hypothetical protein